MQLQASWCSRYGLDFGQLGLHFYKVQNIKTTNAKTSVAGNRTRVSWVKARYPNRWTTTDLLFVIYRKYNMIPFSFRLEQKIENFGCT